MAYGDKSSQLPSGIHQLPATIGDIASCFLTDIVGAAHEVAADLSASVPSYIYRPPATSCDEASSI